MANRKSVIIAEICQIENKLKEGIYVMHYGYVRVSTMEQNTARQEVLMQELAVDKVFIEKISGKDTNRPELQKLMEIVVDGDSVIVESISRFARNTQDLLQLTGELTKRNVEFISKKEAIDTSTPTGQFMLTVFGAVAQLERDYIRQRQAEGIAIAKAAGKYKGKSSSVEEKLLKKLTKDFLNKEITVKDFMKLTGFSRTYIYKICKKYQ